MVVTFPLFIFAYIIYGVMKLIGIFAPGVPESFVVLKDANPFMFSLVISMLASTVTFFISLLFLDNAIAWVGYVIYNIFAAPVIILKLLWIFLSWVIVDVLVVFFVWIWGLLVVVNWGMLGYVFGMGLLILLGVVVTFWVLYRIAVFLFNRGVFNIFIRKSCKVRENRRDKKAERLEIRRKALLAVQKERDKYYKEHKKEIDAKEKARREITQKWVDTLTKTFKPVIWIIQGIVWVVAGAVMSVWWFIKKVGEIFYVLWHMVTSTVSNHCPPIEFIESHEGVGDFVSNRHGGGYMDGKYCRLHIDPEVLPEKFKVRTKQAYYKKVRINYNIVVSRGTDYDDRYHVHSINSIKYLPKPRVSKVKKDTTDGK